MGYCIMRWFNLEHLNFYNLEKHRSNLILTTLTDHYPLIVTVKMTRRMVGIFQSSALVTNGR